MNAGNHRWDWLKGVGRALFPDAARRGGLHDSTNSLLRDAGEESDTDDDNNDDGEAPLIARGAEIAPEKNAGGWLRSDGTVPTLFEICAKMIVRDERLVARLHYDTPLRLEDLWRVVQLEVNIEEEVVRTQHTVNMTGSRDGPGKLQRALNQKLELCDRVVSLNLEDCVGLTDSLLRDICIPKGKAALQSLERLSVSGCAAVSDASLEYVIKQYGSRLKAVQMSRCGVTQRCTRALALWCPNLEVVAFSHQLQIRDKHLIQLVNRCPKLKDINASYCKLLTDASIMTIAEKLWHLESLDLSYCEQVGPSVEGLQRCQFLQGLRLQSCQRVMDGMLKPVIESCSLLEVLCLRSCHYVTMATVEAIRDNCTRLRSLDIVNINGDGNKALAMLAESPELRLSLKEFCSTQRVVLKMTDYLWQLFGAGCE